MSDDQAQIVQLEIDSLQPNPLQPRGVITADSLADLVDSIKQHGLLEPLVAAQTPAGFQLIAGERRWRASRLAGLTRVSVIVKKTTPKGMLEMALVENVQRSDLNPIDRAKAFERLMSEFNLNTTEIAKRVSKSAAYVSNSLRLLKLPDALKDGLLSGLISEGHARALAAIEDTRTMLEAYKLILKENGSVRRAEELARRMKRADGKITKKIENDRRHTVVTGEHIDRMQSNFEAILGKATQVKLKVSRRETKLQITIKGTPTETNPLLEKIHQALAGSSELSTG